MYVKEDRSKIPPTPNQLRLIAILTAQMHIRESRLESFAEVGMYIRELYREREYRKRKVYR